MKLSYVCVGGPKAGRRVEVTAPYFRVPERPASAAAAIHSNEPDGCRYVEYICQSFCFGPGASDHASVWAPSTQTSKQTIELLLETYEIYRSMR